MSSREIAELTGKSHNHVLRDIRSMFAELEISDNGYIHFWTHPQNSQQYTEFQLDRKLTDCLLTGYSAKARMKVIERWHELEEKNKPSLPQTFSEALQLAADQAKQLELQAPKVEFVDNYVSSGDTKCLSDVAKLLNIPRNKFCKQLQDDNIIFKRDGDYRPYSRYEAYFTMKTGNNGDRSWVQCRVNGEGITYLSKRYGLV